MKRILLATTALTALAGAAYADGHMNVEFSGDASVSITSTDSTFASAEDGFDSNLDLNIAATLDLDNGLTAGAEFEIDVESDDDGSGDALSSSDVVFYLESDTASLRFGDTDTATEIYWDSVGDMEADSFSENDGVTVVSGAFMTDMFNVALSAALGDDNNTAGNPADSGSDEIAQMAIAGEATLGAVGLSFAYQEEGDAVSSAGGDYNQEEVFGISGTYTFGGIDFGLGYAQESKIGGGEDTSIGIEVSAPVGPVTLSAYFVDESREDAAGNDVDVDDNWQIKVAYSEGPLSVDLAYKQEQSVDGIVFNVDYDLGNGVELFAGYAGEQDDDGYYIGGSYDLGNGAEFRMIYVDAENEDSGNEYFGDDDKIGLTAAISFSF